MVQIQVFQQSRQLVVAGVVNLMEVELLVDLVAAVVVMVQVMLEEQVIVLV